MAPLLPFGKYLSLRHTSDRLNGCVQWTQWFSSVTQHTGLWSLNTTTLLNPCTVWSSAGAFFKKFIQRTENALKAKTGLLIVLTILLQSDMWPLSRCWFTEWNQLSYASKYCNYSENAMRRRSYQIHRTRSTEFHVCWAGTQLEASLLFRSFLWCLWAESGVLELNDAVCDFSGRAVGVSTSFCAMPMTWE